MLSTGNVFNPVRIWQLGFIAGVMLNIGAAANAPILYLNRSFAQQPFQTGHWLFQHRISENLQAILLLIGSIVQNQTKPNGHFRCADSHFATTQQIRSILLM